MTRDEDSLRDRVMKAAELSEIVAALFLTILCGFIVLSTAVFWIPVLIVVGLIRLTYNVLKGLLDER